jgi:hypothetical protein
LSIKTLADLLQKINEWSQTRKVYHYQNSVNDPESMFIDIFGDIFSEDFARAIALKPSATPEELASKQYLVGIAQQCQNSKPNTTKIHQLFKFLNDLDHRRKTNWNQTFTWLVPVFAQYNLHSGISK